MRIQLFNKDSSAGQDFYKATTIREVAEAKQEMNQIMATEQSNE